MSKIFKMSWYIFVDCSQQKEFTNEQRLRFEKMGCLHANTSTRNVWYYHEWHKAPRNQHQKENIIEMFIIVSKTKQIFVFLWIFLKMLPKKWSCTAQMEQEIFFTWDKCISILCFYWCYANWLLGVCFLFVSRFHKNICEMENRVVCKQFETFNCSQKVCVTKML